MMRDNIWTKKMWNINKDSNREQILQKELTKLFKLDIDFYIWNKSLLFSLNDYYPLPPIYYRDDFIADVLPA